MRTIIINTLGSELRQNPLFYLPFREDRLYWIEKNLKDIGTCPQEICSYQNEQGSIQDYHLIVLVSLTKFADTELKSIRQVYEDTLFAYLNLQLLHPLCQQLQQAPTAASVVYVAERLYDGDGNVEVDKEFDRIFGFTEDMTDSPALQLTTVDGEVTLDMGVLFGDVLESYRQSYANQRSYDSSLPHNYALEQLRQNLRTRVADLQVCSYTPVGLSETRALNTQKTEFFPRTTDWDLFSVDMQLNLSEHLYANLDGSSWRLQLTAHEPDFLRKRITQAVRRVHHLREEAPKVEFYALKNAAVDGIPRDITTDIWTRLRKNTTLPGVEEAYAYTLDPEADKKVDKDSKTKLGGKLRRAWLLLGLAKKNFEKQCQLLEDQYDPKKAAGQQSEILDTCGEAFSDWRRMVLSRSRQLPAETPEVQLPQFDSTRHEQALAEAQQQWGKISVEQLADYTDVRQEAEKLKADFRKAYRLWPDGTLNPTTKFFLYSLVLAAVFLLQMLVPYIGITMTQEGVALSRYVHFFLSLGVFAALYGVGVLFWLTALCRQLHGYTKQLHALLQKSHRRRRDSIVRAVNTYGKVLPQCTVCYEQLQELRTLHEANLQRKERYNTHMQLLAKADELLGELLTLLRLPMDPTAEAVKLKGRIDYQSPPSDPVNVPYYIFMCEKWGC